MSLTSSRRFAARLAALLVALAACASGPGTTSRAAGRAATAAASAGRVAPLGDGFEPLRARFDAAADRPRLLVVASPT